MTDELKEAMHELLVAGMSIDDDCIRLRSSEKGAYVYCGGRAYSGNEVERSKYCEALKKLVKEGLVRHKRGIVYPLTAEGLKLAHEVLIWFK